MARQATRRSFLNFRRNREASEAQEPRPSLVNLPPFWKAMIITSFVVNMVLITVLLFVVGLLFISRPWLPGTTESARLFARGNIVELRDVVAQLQAAHIKTTIPVKLDVPVNLVVPIDQTTLVTTTADIPISVPAAIDLGAFGQLYPNVNLNLPVGTPLLIRLKLDVPLQTSIPLDKPLPIDIALGETELAPQFKRLGDVVDRLVGPVAPLLDIDMQKPGQGPPAP